ncbi:MAG: hypothetical protein ABFC80_00220 [Coriobacteriales bacterium]|nr:hypothetical protein [Actinomycetes bacterium]
MIGPGRTEPGNRYIEVAGGYVGGGSYGWRSDNDRSMPWDFNAMGQHIVDNDYGQAGVSSPGVALQWFYVFP